MIISSSNVWLKIKLSTKSKIWVSVGNQHIKIPFPSLLYHIYICPYYSARVLCLISREQNSALRSLDTPHLRRLRTLGALLDIFNRMIKVAQTGIKSIKVYIIDGPDYQINGPECVWDVFSELRPWHSLKEAQIWQWEWGLLFPLTFSLKDRQKEESELSHVLKN